MKTRILAFVCCIFAWAAPVALAATDIMHNAIGYFVPEKRIRLEANVSDPRGIKLARTYFKVGPQADYLLVPMEASGANRYAAVLPAPSPASDSIEYLFLAVNNDGQVARTDAYTVKARRTGDTPAWQNVRGDGNIKVFTEVANAPMPTTAFSDSVTMDLVESGARFGTVAGLAGSGGAGGGSAAGTSSTTATTTTTTTATTTTAATAGVGGLSTAAIVGGVALAAGAAAAAAGSSGGGGGGGSSSGGGTPGAFAGNWGGSWGYTETGTGTNCIIVTCNGSWTSSVNSSGFLNGNTTGSCTISGIPGSSSGSGVFTGQLASNGSATINSATAASSGICGAFSMQFSLSPRSASASSTCTYSASGCNYTGHWTLSGN